jgi:hypothetical protein
MRTPLLALLITVAPPAISAEFPITGSYGLNDSCRLYKAGGADAIVSGNDATDDVLLITPTEYLGIEFGCNPIGRVNDGTRVACGGEGEAWEAIARIEAQGDTVTVRLDDETPHVDEDGKIIADSVAPTDEPPAILTRCP